MSTPPESSPPDPDPPLPEDAPQLLPIEIGGGGSEVPRWPVSFAARWRRDWRLSAEIVDDGIFQIRDDGILLTGRRSNPVRGLSYLTFRAGLWTIGLTITLATLLTAIGLSWRQGGVIWLVVLPLLVIPALAAAGTVTRRLARRYLEPVVSHQLKWASIRRVASDGNQVEIEVSDPRGRTLRGRFVPRKAHINQRRALAAIRDGRLPNGIGGLTNRPLRPLWIDRVAAATLLIAAGALAVWLEPVVSTWWLRSGHPTTGPLAGYPDPLTPAQLDARRPSSCVQAPASPKIVNRRDGDALAWTVDGGITGWTVAVLRWQAGSGRIDLLAMNPDATGAVADVFQGGAFVGVTALVPVDRVEPFRAILGEGTIESLHTAWCGGMMARIDVSVAPLPGSPLVTATRDGDALVVVASGLSIPTFVLPIRWRPSAEPDLFDLCEIPELRGRVGTVPASPLPLRLEDFFVGTEDQARVYLLPITSAGSLEALGRGGGVQRCMVADSLLWSGAAIAFAATASETAALHQDLRQRAAWEANLTYPLRAGASQASAVDTLEKRYKGLIATLGAEKRDEDEQKAINEGFLDSVPWTAMLDAFSAQSSIAHLEVLRQRLDGADPRGQMGKEFLIGFAEEFMARVPIEQQYSRRIAVGESWLGIAGGTRWTLDGRAVMVAEEAAPTYQIIGRYMLLDTARHLENDINGGQLGLFGSTWSLLPQLQLALHDITIDISKSTKRKGLEAWVTGDFEYILDRVLKKTQAKLQSQSASITHLRASRFSMRTEWGDKKAIRMSKLYQDSSEVGWAAQFDGRKANVTYQPVVDGMATRRSVGGDDTAFLSMAGSYVTSSGTTSGLSVISGRVSNYTITPKMGGLVVLGKEGYPVAILDMRKGGRLPGDTRDIRPLTNLGDFDHLLRWLDKHDASAFQTHVLYADGEPRIEQGKADPEPRERRLLVEAKYGNNPIVVVVDLPPGPLGGGYSLYEAMELTVQALETPESDGGPQLKVVGIGNLDVGAFDILRAWDDQDHEVRTSPKGLSEAHNLITVSL